HYDLQADRPRLVALVGVDHPVANVVVIGCRIGYFARLVGARAWEVDRRHDVLDAAPAGADEIRRVLARAGQELQPARALALGADLGTPHEVAIRDDADELAGAVDHRQSADVVIEHQPRSI